MKSYNSTEWKKIDKANPEQRITENVVKNVHTQNL